MKANILGLKDRDAALSYCHSIFTMSYREITL